MIQTVTQGDIIRKNLPYTTEQIRTIGELVLFPTSQYPTKEEEWTARKNRFTFGTFTEFVAMSIINTCGVITDDTGTVLDVETEYRPCDGSKAEVIDNAINGDFRMRIRLKYGWSDWVYIDVKSGSKISPSSMSRFRKDGYYLMNGFSRSESSYYYLIRNDDEFQRAVKEYKLNSNVGPNGMYDVHFNDTLRMRDYPDLKFIKLLDNKKYEKALKSFRIWMLDNGIRDMLLDNVA